MEEREAGSRFARSEERESIRTRIQRRKTRTGQRHSRWMKMWRRCSSSLRILNAHLKERYAWKIQRMITRAATFEENGESSRKRRTSFSKYQASKFIILTIVITFRNDNI